MSPRVLGRYTPAVERRKYKYINGSKARYRILNLIDNLMKRPLYTSGTGELHDAAARPRAGHAGGPRAERLRSGRVESVVHSDQPVRGCT